MFILKKNGKYGLKEMNISTLKIGNNYELIEKKFNGKQAFIIKEFLEGTNVSSDVKLIGEYTDYYLIDKPGTLDAASGYYFMGHKSRRILSDKELIKLYRGLG